MIPEELGKLASKIENDDPDTAIVLFTLAWAKSMGWGRVFSSYCAEFSRKMIYDIENGNIPEIKA